MSYIRSTSNPEKLYVFGSANGIEWHNRAYSFTIPYEIFDAACREYVETDEAVDHQGLSIQMEKRGDDFKIVLRWGGHEVEMWEVTWDAITDRYRIEDRLRIEEESALH